MEQETPTADAIEAWLIEVEDAALEMVMAPLVTDVSEPPEWA